MLVPRVLFLFSISHFPIWRDAFLQFLNNFGGVVGTAGDKVVSLAFGGFVDDELSRDRVLVSQSGNGAANITADASGAETQVLN
jgi:hypothetical protein